ncbi:MAG: LysM peptidoglycan-binding domain-containing protein [Phycisphaera sp.]|nr:MAG: LysM peptidoglycan-binding domain-containing protein [Phycisphaera sp.]
MTIKRGGAAAVWMDNAGRHRHGSRCLRLVYAGPLWQGIAVTREQKLALIIGFSLILAVGVLISDHLSRAQSEPIVADQEIDQPMVVHRIADVPPGIGETVRPIAGDDAVRVDPGIGGIREPLPGIETAQANTSDGPIEVSMLPRESTATRDPIREPSPRDSNIINTASTDTDSTEYARGNSLPADMFEPVSDYTSRPGIQTRSQIEQSRQTLAQNEQSRGSDRQTPPSPVRHTVDEGESLYAIAERYYGNGNLWPELAKANAGRVNDEGHVLIGAELVIPARKGSPLSIPKTQTLQTRTAQAPTNQMTTNEQFGTYVVQKGDTLSEISQELMGTVRRMNELIKINSDQINDADDIRVGMKLRYPRGGRA